MKYLVTTFYKFFEQTPDEVKARREWLLNKGRELQLKGLLLIGEEGVNSTLSGEESSVNQFKGHLLEILEQEKMTFKDSYADRIPFRRWKVKVRDEIVTIGHPGLVPDREKNHHLSPSEWNAALQEEGVVCIDTRNKYETELGKFKSALDPEIDDFQQFTSFVENSDISKDQKILIYCTGGIRCEKGILELENLGYKNVYQLDGGILNYLKEFPNQEFDGECFVFDHRVGVNQELQPSERWHLCPHCGNPADQIIQCVQCDMDEYVCVHCLEQEKEKPEVKTCSKNCAHHFKLGHKTNKPHLDTLKKKGRSLPENL
ncbi:MAG: hypothetical protein CL677_06985 [Bdellovibrionaceae bacterium]|nr:hypothetical protein [Pseudobdellovibrionaceae bacterium]|tara:strand:+ start:765 stop:1712 length:948 start_codon:yes stop_codon:yes gene_type:complete